MEEHTESEFSNNYEEVVRVNIGCGANKIDGYLNIDASPDVQPDLVSDIRFCRLPIEDHQLDEVFMAHTIEHIQKHHWPTVFMEFNRILKIGGHLVLTFPEFWKCAEKWKKNVKGQREYWEACIYGRQVDHWDVHVALCDSKQMVNQLRDYGFADFKVMPESEVEDQYTILSAIKRHVYRTKEDELNKVVFGARENNGETSD